MKWDKKNTIYFFLCWFKFVRKLHRVEKEAMTSWKKIKIESLRTKNEHVELKCAS
jgi:hypothetical protein